MKKEYCSYCGSLLQEQEPITADHFGGPTPFFFPHPFDPVTGKKRMRKWVACPNKKKVNFWKEFKGKFSFYHDSHAIGEEYLV